ncbi:MAG: (5-formylfuran-3-yl)methyl phosphate synthase [Elusimicrobia bacterium]|nr:(5-formylfuran-3-yl)methyl phosphate synthase [Elusimicrobiota bacterium]
MKLLISVFNPEEVDVAVRGGADILDTKNPLEGSLGANSPSNIRDIMRAAPEKIITSATVGDVPYLPGTVAQAALGVASLGVRIDYIKVALYGPKDYKQALDVMTACVKAVKEFGRESRMAAVGFADAGSFGAVEPFDIPRVARDSGCAVAILDTKVKKGRTLLDFMSLDDIGRWVDMTKSYELTAVLSGSLGSEEFRILKDLEPDILGARTKACSGHDRVNGRLEIEKVSQLKDILVHG